MEGSQESENTFLETKSCAGCILVTVANFLLVGEAEMIVEINTAESEFITDLSDKTRIHWITTLAESQTLFSLLHL
jgi:hypothetical protein